MNTRQGVMLGIALATATTVWWIGATRVALEGGADTALLAARALFVLGLLRAMLIAVLAPRVAATRGYAAGARTALPIVCAAWPVVALAWAASADSIARTALVEVALVCAALTAPALGRVSARPFRDSAAAESVATIVGIAVACSVWVVVTHWRPLAG